MWGAVWDAESYNDSLRFEGEYPSEYPEQINSPIKFTAMDTGYHTDPDSRHFACGVGDDALLYCWGGNKMGQVGDGTIEPSYNGPALIHDPRPRVVIAGQPIGIRPDTTLDITVTGHSGMSAYQYKVGEASSINCADSSDYSSDIPIADPINDDISILSDGPIKLCVIGRDAINYQTLLLPTEATWTKGTPFFAKISVGTNHACGITYDGDTYCWGDNSNSQIGSATANSQEDSPILVDNTLQFSDIQAADQTTCGLSSGGTVYCWGANNYGEVGNGTTGTAVETPTEILGGYQFSKISGQYRHYCGLRTNGNIMCWGDNPNGQVGNGTWGTIQNTPIYVHDAVDIAVGKNHSCSLYIVANPTDGGDDSGVKCWGYNDFYQIGNQVIVNSRSTTPIGINYETNAREHPARRTLVSLKAGYNHTCAANDIGRLFCWGDNQYGQLGRSSSTTCDAANNAGCTHNEEPHSAIINPGAKSYSLKGDSSCILEANGTLTCWGRNVNGQLATGDYVDLISGTPISGAVQTFQSIDLGPNASCGIGLDGNSYCVGLDTIGNQGNGAGDTPSTEYTAVTEP